ncbi:protein CHUP1, chloroplastic [Amborella trichopoda]|uniref:protein CHUP1, chloroplastic n=1 Tax=Amborella trichopoda TaxID=13333 RepID=UPI0005D3F8A9|nr:protein CHUP1, chloroplastic [Amborella trichopoda]|eukprot:XP_011621725.1 protein CHUP1, chloroplastic [Amborella trichopoda]
MKLIIPIKAITGIAAALSLLPFICNRIQRTISHHGHELSVENVEGNSDLEASSSSDCNEQDSSPESDLQPECSLETERQPENSLEISLDTSNLETQPQNSLEYEIQPENSLQISLDNSLEQEIVDLQILVTSLREREDELEVELGDYRAIKDQDSSTIEELMELLEAKTQEIATSCLNIEALQADNLRLKALIKEYQMLEPELESARTKIEVLEHELQRRSRKNREEVLKLEERMAVLQAREDGSSRKEEESRKISERVKELKDEILVQRRINQQLQKERAELAIELSLAQGSTSPSNKRKDEDAEAIVVAEKQLLESLEKIQTKECFEVEELIYLRQVDACLRSEQSKERVMGEPNRDWGLNINRENNFGERKHTRMNLEESDTRCEEQKYGEYELECRPVTEMGNCNEFYMDFGSYEGQKSGLRKGRLIDKVKRWVKGRNGCKRRFGARERVTEREEGCPRRWSFSEGEHLREAEFMAARNSSATSICTEISVTARL